MDIGVYWYDDKKTRKNGEFDCALEFNDGYDIYEAKYLKEAMTLNQGEAEAEKIRDIAEIKARKIGFVSIEGFEFTSSEYELIKGDDLYDNSLSE